MGNLNKSNQITTVVLLVLMIASTFIGIPLNGGDKGWVHIYDAELGLFTWTLLGPQKHVWLNVILVFQLITHIALFALPFLTRHKRFFTLLVGIPLLYLLLQAVTFYVFLILLIPFIILWALALTAWAKRNT